MRILVLDNYDSFTYNLVHILRELGYGEQMEVYRNDKISLEEVAKYDKILLSPGPGIPSEAGILLDLIKEYGPSKDIFGVCLGHQAIAEAFNSQLYNMKEVLHGFADKVIQESEGGKIFEGLPKEIGVCRYHSWAVHPEKLDDQLMVTARDRKGEIMAIQHKNYKIYGVQFHPESILTEHGKQMLINWLRDE